MIIKGITTGLLDSNKRALMKVIAAGSTDIGMKRTHNEDSLYIFPETHLYMVADGMGGHSSGEVASQMAVETVAEFFKATAEDNEVTWPFKEDRSKNYDSNRLVTSIKLANQRIYEAALRDARYRGMGTTIVTVSFVDNKLFVAHVGDSRVYRLRENRIEQLTEDHSLLNDYIKMKKLTSEEIENFPHKNVIVRALGMKDAVEVDIQCVEMKAGDIYLLCSDGLSGMVTDEELHELVTRRNRDARTDAELQEIVRELIDIANQYGGNDNITVLLLKCLRN